LPTATVEALKQLAQSRGSTMTEVLKAAISTENFLTKKGDAGARLLLAEKDGSMKELVFSHRLDDK
jgi:hypothetical protein